LFFKSQRTDILVDTPLPQADLLTSVDTFRKSDQVGNKDAVSSTAGPPPGTSGTTPVVETTKTDDKTLDTKSTSIGPDGSILDVIGNAEGAGYNTPYGGSKITPFQFYGKQLSELTLQEVFDWQDASVDAGSVSSAAGKYQIINKTLLSLVDGDGVVSRTDLFSPANQDKLCRKLLQRRGIDAFISGKKSEPAFCRSLAQEWASLPVTFRQQGDKRIVNTGESYYEGVAGNKSRISPTQLIAAARNAKETGYA